MKTKYHQRKVNIKSFSYNTIVNLENIHYNTFYTTVSMYMGVCGKLEK